MVLEPADFKFDQDYSEQFCSVFKNKRYPWWIAEINKGTNYNDYYNYYPDEKNPLGEYLGTKFFDDHEEYTLFGRKSFVITNDQ